MRQTNQLKCNKKNEGNNYPLVSIVLPTYNGSKYISETIESVIVQTYRDWELIIVNDASTDNSEKIILHYANRDPRIITIRNENNLRLPSSLNNGFSIARGDLFTWTSDDNLYRPNALERMVQTLTDNKKYHVVYADHSIIDSKGKLIRRVIRPKFERLSITNSIGPCFMYRKDVHNALGGYDSSKYLVEDYDYWLRASSRYRFLQLHENLYLFRTHNESLTFTYKRRILEAQYFLLKKSVPNLSWMTKKKKKGALVRNESFWTRRHYLDESYRQAICSSWSLIRENPVSVYPWLLYFRYVPVSLIIPIVKKLISKKLCKRNTEL